MESVHTGRPDYVRFTHLIYYTSVYLLWLAEAICLLYTALPAGLAFAHRLLLQIFQYFF